MMLRICLAAAALLLGGAAFAVAGTEGEFDGECVMGLALGKDTDRLLGQHDVQRQDLLLRQRDGQGRLPQAPGGVSHQGAGVLLKQEPIAACAMNAVRYNGCDRTLSGGGQSPWTRRAIFVPYTTTSRNAAYRKGRAKWRVEVPSG